MPRKPTAINEQALEALKTQLRIRLKLDCSSFADMQQLQSEIKNTMGEYLSLQTLNRLFGIIKTHFNPSYNTLNVLSQFLGYQSIAEFERLNDGNTIEMRPASFESKFLLSIFSTVQAGPDSLEALQQVVRNILVMMRNNPDLAGEIYPAMASIPFGRKYFFEQFINMDALDRHYGDGLKYYLLHAGNREQQFFAYNMYCLRYFLTAETELFRKYCDQVNAFGTDEITGFDARAIGGYLATRILQKYMNGNAGQQEGHVADSIPLPGNNPSAYQARYRVAEALVLCGEFEKAWDWLNTHLHSFSFITRGEDDFITQVCILRLISGFYSGSMTVIKARQSFSELQSRQTCVSSQDYHAILLLLIKKNLFPKAVVQKEVDLKINRLIQKTGFNFFHRYEQLLEKTQENFLMDINGRKKS